jgi:hypothetical protein
MKLIMMQLCENCAEFVEGEKYKRLQEKYKWITTNKISLHNEQDSDQH